MVGPEAPALLAAWEAYRRGVLPDPGGFLQQPAKLMAAFAVMDAAAAVLGKARKGRMGGR
jgi:hypothetical protein